MCGRRISTLQVDRSVVVGLGSVVDKVEDDIPQLWRKIKQPAVFLTLSLLGKPLRSAKVGSHLKAAYSKMRRIVSLR